MKTFVVLFLAIAATIGEPDAKADPEAHHQHTITNIVEQPITLLRTGQVSDIPLTESQVVEVVEQPLLKPRIETSRVVTQEIIDRPELYKSIPLNIQELPIVNNGVPLVTSDQVLRHDLVEGSLLKPAQIDISVERKNVLIDTQQLPRFEIVETRNAPLEIPTVRKELPIISSNVEYVNTPVVDENVRILRKDTHVTLNGLDTSHFNLFKTDSIEVPKVRTDVRSEFILPESFYKTIPVQSLGVVPNQEIFTHKIVDSPQGLFYKNLPLEIPEIPAVRKEVPLTLSNIGLVDSSLVGVEVPTLRKDISSQFDVFQKGIPILPRKETFTHRIVETPQVNLYKNTPVEISEGPVVTKEIPVQQDFVNFEQLYKNLPFEIVHNQAQILPRKETFTHKIVETPHINLLKTAPLEISERSFVSKDIPVQQQFVNVESLFRTLPLEVVPRKETFTDRIVEIPQDNFYKTSSLDIPRLTLTSKDIPLRHGLVAPETLLKTTPLDLRFQESGVVRSNRLVEQQVPLYKTLPIDIQEVPLVRKEETSKTILLELPQNELLRKELNLVPLQSGRQLVHGTQMPLYVYQVPLDRKDLPLVTSHNIYNQDTVGSRYVVINK